jgi:hypothetical protein
MPVVSRDFVLVGLILVISKLDPTGNAMRLFSARGSGFARAPIYPPTILPPQTNANQSTFETIVIGSRLWDE